MLNFEANKLKDDRAVDELPIPPFISNISPAQHHQLEKYLARLLSPLSTSEYTVKSTSDFITHKRTDYTEQL